MKAVGIMKSRCSTMCMALIAAVIIAIGTSGALPFPALSSVIVAIGGTGNPSGKKPDVAQVIGGSLAEGRTVEYIATPQQFWPVNGPLTLNQSVAEGTALTIEAIRNQQDPDALYAGPSQGAVVLGSAINYFVANPEGAPSPENAQFVLVASPIRPNGGVLARIQGINIPIVDIGYHAPTLPGPYKTVDAVWAYDMYANAPLYVNNPLSWFNAVNGLYNPSGKSLHETDPDYTNPDYDVRTEVVGNTTYHTLIPKHLPMFQTLIGTEWEPLVDLIEPLVKVWVDAGYYKNDPAADPGTHRPLQLFMPLENVVRALQQSPGAIIEGLKTIPENLNPPKNQPEETIAPNSDDNDMSSTAVTEEVTSTSYDSSPALSDSGRSTAASTSAPTVTEKPKDDLSPDDKDAEKDDTDGGDRVKNRVDDEQDSQLKPHVLDDGNKFEPARDYVSRSLNGNEPEESDDSKDSKQENEPETSASPSSPSAPKQEKSDKPSGSDPTDNKDSSGNNSKQDAAA